MIVTKSWLNEWIDLSKVSLDELAKTLNSIGLEVDSIHSYNVAKGIVFGRVLECEKHPEADKLSICKVDIGNNNIVQIVCGASNVRAGLDVVVATIGTIMPSGLEIKPVKLRGIESNGMICSAVEIGLEDCQSGIIELDKSIGKYTIGDEVSTHPIFNDDVIEIELTANRGDCLSIRGVARDLSAALDKPLRERTKKEDEEKRVGIGRILSLGHENSSNVNLKYKAIELKELNLPFLAKLRLSQIDLKHDSLIDSFIAYATHSSGVILKAYNYGFFASQNQPLAKIRLIDDENGFAAIVTKDGLRASTIGVSQENDSKVTYNDGIVLIEASYVNPDDISKKMQNKKIASGSDYYRSSRGSEPNLDLGLEVCIEIIEKNSLSSIFGGTIKLCNDLEEKIISVSKSEIDEIIGTKIDKAKITKILKNLEFDTDKSAGDNFIITVPPHRHDIINRQDIAEEIVRMVKIDNIPSKPFIFAEENRLNNDYFTYKKRQTYRQKAAYNGFFESVHFVFDERKTLIKFGFEAIDEDKELLNPIVNTLDTLRTTLLTSLLKSASNNSKNGYSSIRLFEVGSVFNSQREESLKMGLLFCGEREAQSISNAGKPAKVDFAFFAQKLSDIIGDFRLSEYRTKHTLSHPFVCAKVIVDNVEIGEVFRVHPNIEKEYDLDISFMCELDFDKLPFEIKKAKERSKYQASFRDLSVVVPKTIAYETIKSVIDASTSADVKRFYPVDRYNDEILGENISLTIRFMLQSDEKTLEEDDINNSINAILGALDTKLGIGLR